MSSPKVIESPLRETCTWMSAEVAEEAVVAFGERFGDSHARLACHAAFPMFLTPELLNLIRINFLGDEVTWLAEPDFLLSPLCLSLDAATYVVDPRARELLLADLINWYVDEAPARLRNLALKQA